MESGVNVVEIRDADGVVKWFDPRKGFGFIIGPEGQDIFAHYSVIEAAGFKLLHDGTTVRYSAVNTPKGWRATAVAEAVPVVEVHINGQQTAADSGVGGT